MPAHHRVKSLLTISEMRNTRVATKTISEVTSPLDRIAGKLKEGAEPPA